MEALLSLAFDNLSSLDSQRIRKGLRQVEGLLAQICLSPSSSSSSSSSPTKSSAAEKRRSAVEPLSSKKDNEPPPPRKDLAELSLDPAFREFFKLQEGFEWNVTSRLLMALDRLLGKSSHGGDNDLVIIQTLALIQGMVLLHPPSRNLFRVEQNMTALLDLLEPENCPAIHSSTILTLVCALIDTPTNTRAFEELDGLFTITSLFKSRETTREVKFKLVEFLYFYLMPETPSLPSAAASNGTVPAMAMLQRSPSKLAGAFMGRTEDRNGRKRADSESDMTRTTEQKQEFLGRYLSSVQDLVADLRENTPFGGVLC